LAVAFAICILSMLGFPLAGGVGFFAKWQLLQAAMQATVPQRMLAIVLVLSSIVSAGYYLALIAPVFMKPAIGTRASKLPVPFGVQAIAIGCAVLVLALGVMPSSLTRLAQRSAPAMPASPSAVASLQP
jgi:NADH-quinone oxidoreductase subunit N